MAASKRPRLAVVIGTYNRLGQLRRCLDSLMGRLPIPHEIWVVDAGSTDGTVDYLRTLDGIRTVFEDRRRGQAVSYNDVFRRLDTEYVVWLSDDNVAVPEVLTDAVEDLECHADIGMIGLKTKDVSGPFAHAPFIGGIASTGILNVNQGLLRLDLLQRVGFFSEEFPDYGIDMDLTTKILLCGYKVAYTKRIGVYHDRRWMEDRESPDVAARLERHRRAVALYNEKYASLIPVAGTKRFLRRVSSLLRRPGAAVDNARSFLRRLECSVGGRTDDTLGHTRRNFERRWRPRGPGRLFSKEALSYNPKRHPRAIVFLRNAAYFLLWFVVGGIPERPVAPESCAPPLSDRLAGSVPVLGPGFLDWKRSLHNVIYGEFISLGDFFRSAGKRFYLVQWMEAARAHERNRH